MRPIRWYDSQAGGDPGITSQPRTLNQFQQEKIQSLPEELREQARLVSVALEHGLAALAPKGQVTGPHVWEDASVGLYTIDLSIDIERPKFLPFDFYQYTVEVVLDPKACCLDSLHVRLTHYDTIPAINEIYETVHTMPFGALKTLTRQLMRNRDAITDFFEMASHFQKAQTEVYHLEEMVEELGCHEDLEKNRQEAIENSRVERNNAIKAKKKQRKDNIDSLNKSLNNS